MSYLVYNYVNRLPYALNAVRNDHSLRFRLPIGCALEMDS